MVVCPSCTSGSEESPGTHLAAFSKWLFFCSAAALFLLAISAFGQDRTPDWRNQIRKYCESQDWASAMRVVDHELARAPHDLEVRAWRARVLTWSGRLPEAEKEYEEILTISRNDPDIWMGLASIFLREGRSAEALRVLDVAVELDPKRPDLHAARARALLATGKPREALREFPKALALDPANVEARSGLTSLREEPKHELRFGQDNDLFNFADANHSEAISLTSRWTPHWMTSLAETSYQRAGTGAEKFAASATGRAPRYGALTLGAAIAHDNTVIPMSEAFFELDHGWKLGETHLMRGFEFAYGQHWYWYQSSRILALNGTAVAYLPRDWSLSVLAIGARSAFHGKGAEWRPSGLARVNFPLLAKAKRRLTGNVFFGAGTENFAQVDQIGSFASQTYGGGLRFQITTRQDLTSYASYQKRTQNRTDTSVGLSYGIRF